VKRLLVDSGPLIALFDRSDQYHTLVVNHLKTVDEVLLTTWPVVTEVSHMLDFHIDAQLGFLKWIELGGLEVRNLNEADVSRIVELVEKYSNVPMDVADASLLILAEDLDTRRILSIDSDFEIFRTRYKDQLVNELPIYG
jgi:hypothetical protein